LAFRARTHTRTHAHTHARTHAHTHARTHAHTHTHTHTHYLENEYLLKSYFVFINKSHSLIIVSKLYGTLILEY